MVEPKIFSGIMNLDDKPEFIQANQHINALNVRFYGSNEGYTLQNILGNSLISNSLPAGDNECIGSFYDSLKQRIFWMNWNSNGRNGIYQYAISTGVITPLLISFTDSSDDIFEFDPDYPIPSINIVYTTEEDGDILIWVARNNRPKELNIKDAIDDRFGSSWLAEYLDVAKAPPDVPIACAYENDDTVIVNNLKNKLYRFKYRFIYGTFQKSTWSSISIMPIPFQYTDQEIDTDQTKNCLIALIFQTGGEDVEKIEIAAQENLGVTWGNFFSVQILDKSELSISSYDSYIWRFYNNEAYDYVDENESNLLFDYVPYRANTQELLNGNVLIYGGITEGNNPVVPEVDISVSDMAVSVPNISVGLLATQMGQNGLNTGNIRISLVGLPSYPVSSGTPTGVSVNIFNGTTTDNLIAAALSSSTTIADLISQLETAALGFGYTIVSSTSDSLVISLANQVLLNYFISGNGDRLAGVNVSVPAIDPSSKETFGIVYFNEKYVSNGTTTSEDFSVSTPPISFSGSTAILFPISRVVMLIYHQPPEWARYYQIVRTMNLTKSTFLNWVSDRTFKDEEFAYISIESINTYKVQFPTSIISYDFLTGDRIKFVCLFNNDQTINTTYGNTHDYEIVGQVVNPLINGLVQEGTFLKVDLPSTSSTFDFGDFLSNDYYYYYIELYTPAKSVANGLNVSYEFSEMFQIGDPYTATRFHQGNVSNQNVGLGTPASLNLLNGDNYWRRREIRAGSFFNANAVPDIITSWVTNNVYPMTIENKPVGTSYTVKNTESGSTTNQNNWLVKTGSISSSFTAKGALFFTAQSATTNTIKVFLQVRSISPFAITDLIELATLDGPFINGQQIQLDVDSIVTIAANRTAVPYLQEIGASLTGFTTISVSGYINFVDTDHDFNIGVVDQNFSDFFESKVNSNGRPSVVNPDEKQLFYPTLMRWGLSYQQNTNINQINRFFPENFDEIDRSKGDIQRFKTRDKIIRVFQNRAVGQFGVYARFIQNNQGQTELVTTNDIITKNNINYYLGEYGLGDQYTGLVSASRQDYFVDPVRGYEVRLSDDGFTPISELYKGQFYIRNLLTPYNQTYTRSNGYKAKILGVYNFFDEEYITVLQGGTKNSTTISPYAFSFNEKRNGYSSFFSYNQAEWLISAEDIIYSWKNGELWIHNNQNEYCNFYGIQYDSYITVVFNNAVLIGKTFQSIDERANTILDCPSITTDVMSYGTTNQETNLVEAEFKTLESKYVASIKRDVNSIGGKINGSFMKGRYAIVTLRKQNASELVVLNIVQLYYIESPVNNR